MSTKMKRQQSRIIVISKGLESFWKKDQLLDEQGDIKSMFDSIRNIEETKNQVHDT